jgi:elongator complex protein 1
LRSNIIPGSINVSEYVLTTARGSATPPHDHGVVAVIDGQVIKITPFRAANIPPPMALHEITVHSNVIDVTFNVDATSIAVLHQQGISMFEWESTSASSSVPVLAGRYTFEDIQLARNIYQQISFGAADNILVLQQQGTNSLVARYSFDGDTGRMSIKASVDSPISTLTTLSSFNEKGSVHPFAQDMSGTIQSLTFGSRSLAHIKLPIALPWIEIASYNDSQIAFGMSSSGHLYANSRLLVKNCTSFLITNAHLVFTTTTHLVKFVHITDVHGMSRFKSCFRQALTLGRSRSTPG